MAVAACGGSDSSSDDGEGGSSEGGELTKVTLGLDWTWLGYHMAFLYAQQEGWYEEAGIDLTIQEGQGSGTTVKLVGNGTVDIGFADSSTMVQAVGSGVPIRNILLIWQTGNFGTICDVDSGVREPKDLEGKSVLLIPTENVSAVWPVFLEKNGVDASKITVLNADYTNKDALFIAGEADCMAGVDGQDILLARYQRPEITDDDVMRWQDYGVNAPGHGLVVSNSYLESNEDLLKRFVEVTIRGWKAICENTQIGVDLYTSQFPDAEPDYVQFAKDNLPYECEKTIPLGGSASDAYGPTDDEFWQALLDAQIKYAGLPDSVTVDQVYTNDLLP